MNLPWCSIGDFNDILGSHEHRGATPPATAPMNDFFDWSDSNNFHHLPTRGVQFTWSNGRDAPRHTERRLDRVICNNAWLDLCSSLNVSTLVNHKSDHFPILLDFETSTHSFASQFKFMHMWSQHEDCKRVIQETWNINIVGCPMYILNQKLKILKQKLKIWNKTIFGNVHNMVRDAEHKLSLIQSDIDILGITDFLMDQHKVAQIQLENVLNIEEEFWREKSKVTWHTDGDRNTKYFHRLTKIKNTSKLINSLMNGDNMITDPEEISSHITNHYKNIFAANIVVQDLQVSQLIEDSIPNLISEEVNTLLTRLPTPTEIHEAVMAMNKDGAPSPDGFGASFFQSYWDIVKLEVINAVLEFFTKDWILPNFNANTIILIPKVPDAMNVGQYRPIALANFKFKIISKILANRLAPIMNNIISPEQRGFIKGRNIKDGICITSEAINHLHQKSFAGNVAFKVDISKAFDTLEWKFLLTVLSKFGFNSQICSWIHTILKSATLSISVNGKQNGYFHCKRGVRQGDPFSPLLFCIAEDVLSRNITKLVQQNKIDLIKGSRSTSVPSHSLYADDIMIFGKGRISSIQALMQLFTSYALASGQIINPAKSTVFFGSISNARINYITELIGFNKGSLPFTYLGVPIFKGKPKRSHLQPIADRIKSKLSAWKASLLSIAGRVTLVKSVIQSMLVHSISIYCWPKKLLREIESWSRNFIWSGDISKRKLVTVSWKETCKPLSEGGLGIRSLILLNESTNLKLCWDLLNSQEDWAIMIRSKVLRGRRVISHHIYSSIWSSIKFEFDNIMLNSGWQVGNGNNINFWLDKWCGDTIVSQLNVPSHLHSNLTATVSDFIVNGQWSFPISVLLSFPEVKHMVEQVTIPIEVSEDKLLWVKSNNENLSYKEAFLFKYGTSQNMNWAKTLWSPDIPPSKSLLVWRLMHNRVPTDENLMSKGVQIPTMCSTCNSNCESSFHLFFECSYAMKIWNWLFSIINIYIQFSTLGDFWSLLNRNWSPQCNLVLKACMINIINTIWLNRNNRRFQDKQMHWKSAINLIIAQTSVAGNNTNASYKGDMQEFTFLKACKVKIRPPRAPTIKEVIWIPPLTTWIKVNTDGAATKNPCKASAGGIFRNSESLCIGCFFQFLGLQNALYAELVASMLAIEIAYNNGFLNLWLESDSQLVILAFKSNTVVPWGLRNRWQNCMVRLKSMRFVVSHIYREGNACADRLANLGLSMSSLEVFWSDYTPDFIRGEYTRNRLGMPNFRFTTF